MRRLALGALLGLLGTGTAAVADEPLGRYLADLEKARRLPAEAATLDGLKATVAAAEEHLVRRDARAASRLLFAIVESPRHHTFKHDVSYQNAELLLGRALLRGRAYRSAERYLTRVLSRGPTGPFYLPAARAMVDLALDTRETARIATVLSTLGGAPPSDTRNEIEYLRGRAAYDAGDLAAAGQRLAAVGRSSRLYPAAAYLRGLVAARQRRLDEARKAFCEIVDQKDHLAFVVDDRYFSLRDLARLALGRVSHEQGRFDDAYYFYFSVPEDSERLAEALYEAAWSMYQKGENDAAQAFVEQLDRLFPQSPLRPDAALLRANIDVKSCAFDRARERAAALVTTFQPIAQQAAAMLRAPRRQRELVARMLVRDAGQTTTTDPDGTLIGLLKLDGKFRALLALVHDIDADIAEMTASVGLWRALGHAAGRPDQVAAPAASPEAAALLDEITSLVPLAAGDDALEARTADLMLEATLMAYPPRAAGPYGQEAAEAGALARKLAALRKQAVAALEARTAAALAELDGRLRALFRQSRLVQIDAAVGKKKKLEREIADLYAGKLPPALYHKLKAEGTLGDDEEYWPFEGEHWKDEYEKYR